MATVFSSQWEGSGILDSSAWAGEVGTPGFLSVDTAQHLQNTHALKLVANGTSDLIYKTITATSILGIRVPVRKSSVTTTGTLLILQSDSTGHISCRLRLASGTLYVERNSTGAAYEIVGSAFSYSSDTWYQIEILYTQNTSVKWKVWDATGSTLLHTEQVGSAPYYNETNNSFFLGAYDPIVGTVWVDSFVADNAAYPGPYVNNVTYTKTMSANAILNKVGIVKTTSANAILDPWPPVLPDSWYRNTEQPIFERTRIVGY